MLCVIDITETSLNKLLATVAYLKKQPLELKKDTVKNFANFTKKTLVLESVLNKIAGLWVCNFFKKRLQQMCFPSEICKIFKIAYFEKYL